MKERAQEFISRLNANAMKNDGRRCMVRSLWLEVFAFHNEVTPVEKRITKRGTGCSSCRDSVWRWLKIVSES